MTDVDDYKDRVRQAIEECRSQAKYCKFDFEKRMQTDEFYVARARDGSYYVVDKGSRAKSKKKITVERAFRHPLLDGLSIYYLSPTQILETWCGYDRGPKFQEWLKKELG